MGRSHRQDHTKLCSELLKTRVGRQIERIWMQNAAIGGRGFGRHLPCKKLEFSLPVDDAVLTVGHVPWPRRLGHPAARMTSKRPSETEAISTRAAAQRGIRINFIPGWGE